MSFAYICPKCKNELTHNELAGGFFCKACGDGIVYKKEELESAGCFSATHEEQNTSNDVVNNPAHYTDGKIEVIDFIEDKKLGYHLGNAIKYIARAGKKNPNKKIEDIQKAIWYLERFVQKNA